jgi:hypothetical protein
MRASLTPDPGPSSREAAVSNAEGGAGAFVWGVWASLTVGSLAFVRRYGSKVPFWDDWGLVPARTGARPITAAWLWEQYAEYRFPLPKLVLLALARVTGNDLRADMVFGVVMLAALAGLMIHGARRVRGRTEWSDAFFPLALLHLGHHAHMLWSGLGVHLLATFLLGIPLLVIVSCGARLETGPGVLLGLSLIGLTLSGRGAIVYVPPLAAWLGYAGVSLWRTRPDRRRGALVVLTVAVAAVLTVAAYFVGFRPPYDFFGPDVGAPRAFTAIDRWTASAQFLSLGFGPAASAFWPLAGLVAAGLALATLGVLGAAACRRGAPGRLRTLGLLSLGAGSVTLTLVVGWRRTEAAFDTYYAISAVPAWFWIHFVWMLHGPPPLGRRVQVALCGILGLMFSLNTLEGLYYGPCRSGPMQAFERDLKSGTPTPLLIKRHGPVLCPSVNCYYHAYHNLRTESFPALRRAGVGPFRRLRDDPGLQAVPLPIRPSALHQIAWRGDGGWAGGAEAHAEFRLPEPRYVTGLRIRYAHSNAAGSRPYLRVGWNGTGRDRPAPGRAGGPGGRWYLEFLFPLARSLATGIHDRDSSPLDQYLDYEHGPGPDEQGVTIWICDEIDRFLVYPGMAACEFHLAELTLLVPHPAQRR